jgi:hypothetical protein
MKYYLDFGGKYFNSDKYIDGFKQAVERNIYFTGNAPLHDDNYIVHSFHAGNGKNGNLFLRQRDNKSFFITSLFQDRPDMINFRFSYTKGYDEKTKEFYGICNYIDLSNIISDDRKDVIDNLRKRMPNNIQPYLLQENGESDVNQILIFYKLKDNIEF